MTDYKPEIEDLLDTCLHPERNGLLIKEGVSEGANFEWLVKRELAEALTHLINKAVVKELDDIYDSINTGNVYLALGKVKRRIKELEQ